MNVLDEANDLVNGVRQEKYGHPSANHGATAEMWTTYLERRGLLVEGAVIDGHDVCILNILQKTSRDANVRQRDNLVDIAGFALNAEMVDDAEENDVARRVSDVLADANYPKGGCDWRRPQTEGSSRPPVMEPTIQLVTMTPGERRFEKPVRTKPRQGITDLGLPVAFPLLWADQYDDIIRAIYRERKESFHEPECIFLPQRKKDEGKDNSDLGDLRLWGIPVEIDKTLAKDEFVFRAYRRVPHIVEFRHYRFSEGPVD